MVLRGKTHATTYLAAREDVLNLSLTGSRLDLSPLSSEQSQNLPQLGERLPSRGGGPTLASLRFTAPGGGAGRARPSQHATLAPGSEFRVSADRDELKVKVYGEALKGTVDVPAGARVDWEPSHGQADPKRQFNETAPDVVDFHAQIRPTLPFVVSVRDPDQWDFLVDVERKLTFNRGLHLESDGQVLIGPRIRHAPVLWCREDRVHSEGGFPRDRHGGSRETPAAA